MTLVTSTAVKLFISTRIALSLTVCAVLQAPAVAQAFIISVVVQLDGVGVCNYQTRTLSTTQLHGFRAWNSYLLRQE